MNNVKVEDRLYGDSKFNSWNSMVLIILEENDLLGFVNEKGTRTKRISREVSMEED